MVGAEKSSVGVGAAAKSNPVAATIVKLYQKKKKNLRAVSKLNMGCQGGIESAISNSY